MALDLDDEEFIRAQQEKHEAEGCDLVALVMVYEDPKTGARFTTDVYGHKTAPVAIAPLAATIAKHCGRTADVALSASSNGSTGGPKA